MKNSSEMIPKRNTVQGKKVKGIAIATLFQTMNQMKIGALERNQSRHLYLLEEVEAG